MQIPIIFYELLTHQLVVSPPLTIFAFIICNLESSFKAHYQSLTDVIARLVVQVANLLCENNLYDPGGLGRL